VETTSLITSKLKERMKISKAKIGIKNMLRVRNPSSLNKSEELEGTEESTPGLKPTASHPFLELPEKVGITIEICFDLTDPNDENVMKAKKGLQRLAETTRSSHV
jgi:hypothetical protein